MRPPFGYYDKRFEKIIGPMGYKVFLWNFATKDWKILDDAQNILSNFKINFEKSSHLSHKKSFIILQHDTQKLTMKIQNEMIKYILDKKFKIVKLNECIQDSFEYELQTVSLRNESIKSNVTLIRNGVYVKFYYKNFPDLSLKLYYFICLFTISCLTMIIFFYKQYLRMNTIFFVFSEISS
jgi:hypothetical protein